MDHLIYQRVNIAKGIIAPKSLLLLDEIEKAHPDVFNVLLQVLEDGRLTDSQGRTVDFKNTVIVMTSNLGSDIIQDLTKDKSLDSVSFDKTETQSAASDAEMTAGRYQAIKTAVMNVVSTHFRPEFINRIDESVVFHPLGKEHIGGIAKIQIDILAQRLVERELALELSDAVFDTLVAEGYDPVYGARPLKRVIQQLLENPLAQRLLAGDFVAGDTIFVDVEVDDSKGFSFSKRSGGE